MCIAAAVSLPACFVLDSTPPLPACAPKGSTRSAEAPASGVLRVLPSLVPELEIDSAGWKTHKQIAELGTELILLLAARIQVARDVDLDSLALVYGTTGPRGARHAVIADPELNAPIYTAVGTPVMEDRKHSRLAADTVLRTERIVRLDGRWSIEVCPATVQIVPRHALPLHMFPGRFGAARSHPRPRRQVNSVAPSLPLEVVWDSAVDPGFGSPLPLGVVRNRSDSVVTGAVAALVLHKANPRPGLEPSKLDNPVDTLEYALPSVPPQGVVGFSGGFFLYLDSIAERLVYPGTAVRGRAIASERDHHRVSRVPKRRNDP